MAFNDDDLKQWKEITRREFEWEPVPVDKLRALLARLEAAERCADRLDLISPFARGTGGLVDLWKKSKSEAK